MALLDDAARLDEMHDAGEDLIAHLDLPGATRPGREVQRVNVDFPIDLLQAIDREARRIGVAAHGRPAQRRTSQLIALGGAQWRIGVLKKGPRGLAVVRQNLIRGCRSLHENRCRHSRRLTCTQLVRP
jgi:hypothetical protein